MTKARQLADLGNAYDDGALSNRNLIINGAMQVAQRGTSSTSTGYVSLDRWYFNTSGGSGTFSQETNANPSETDGIRTYARVNVSSSSDFTGIRTRIEDVTKVKSGTVTLSFWAKGTAPFGGLRLFCGQDFGTGGSSDVDIAGIQVTPTLTSSWVRYETQIIVPSIDGKTINDGSFFAISIMQGTNTSSTAYDLNITGVQLEVGDTATPFEHRSYGDELAKCQRYYEVIGNWSSTSQFYAFPVFKVRSASIGIPMQYRVEKRASPSVTMYDRTGVTTGVLTQISNGTNLAIQYGPTGDKRGVYRTQHATQPVDVTTSAYGLKATVDAEL